MAVMSDIEMFLSSLSGKRNKGISKDFYGGAIVTLKPSQERKNESKLVLFNIFDKLRQFHVKVNSHRLSKVNLTKKLSTLYWETSTWTIASNQLKTIH